MTSSTALLSQGGTSGCGERDWLDSLIAGRARESKMKKAIGACATIETHTRGALEHLALDELCLMINRERGWLRRAVDDAGEVLDILAARGRSPLVQRRRSSSRRRRCSLSQREVSAATSVLVMSLFDTLVSGRATNVTTPASPPCLSAQRPGILVLWCVHEQRAGPVASGTSV